MGNVIDWATRSRTLRLAYLFRGEYHDAGEVLREVYWCGPRTRTGSGLTLPVPIAPSLASRGISPEPKVWEARLSDCTYDVGLGGLAAEMMVLGDCTFNVTIQGGPEEGDKDGDEEGSLLLDCTTGRWRNKHATLWLYDLDTGDHQIVMAGFFDRNPTSITASGFEITIASGPFQAARPFHTQRFPNGVNDWRTPADWSQATGSASTWYPNEFAISPFLRGRQVGKIYGTGYADMGWRELIPYGRTPEPSGSSNHYFVYCHVSFQRNCFVHSIWHENGKSTESPLEAIEHIHSWSDLDTPQTFDQPNPLNGPTGTCLRFKVADVTSTEFRWWQAPYPRIFAMVSGPDNGQLSDLVDDVWRLEWANPYMNDRLGGLFAVLQDVVSNIDLWGTNALADFETQNPLTAIGLHTAVQALVPDKLQPEGGSDFAYMRPPSMRGVLQDLAGAFGFDIVQRFDPAVDNWRLWPVWRPRNVDKPLHLCGPEHLANSRRPDVVQSDDPDGFYANTIEITGPDRNAPPAADNIEPPQAGGVVASYLNGYELAYSKEVLNVHGDRKFNRWNHFNAAGNTGYANQYLGPEQAQPQRSIRAVHGVRSFEMQLGETLAYDIRGVNPATGQIRHLHFNYDNQTVEVKTNLADHTGPRGHRVRGQDESMPEYTAETALEKDIMEK